MAHKLMSKAQPSSSPTRFEPAAVGTSLWAVEQRLANAERELRIQFTRLAQMQAELDLLRGEHRRPR